jgi:hypothetical protein
MDIRDRESLEQFAREHHVHYDVEPQAAIHGRGQQEVIGFDLRLLATHGESKLEAPACPRCVELLSGLQSFAERIVASADASSWTEIVPEPAVLYQSAEVRGADEVALTIRILRDPSERSGGAGDDPRLGAFRERLETLGVPRRP